MNCNHKWKLSFTGKYHNQHGQDIFEKNSVCELCKEWKKEEDIKTEEYENTWKHNPSHITR